MGQKSVMLFVVALLISLWCFSILWSGFSGSWSGFSVSHSGFWMQCGGLIISWYGLSR